MRFQMVGRIAQKELALFFSSPIGYLFLLAFLGVTLFVFFWGEAFFARNIADVRPMFEWLPVLLIFLASALTMRMWSDERRTRTLELLVTVPATTWEFVVGKFMACWLLLIVALVLTLPLPITVSLMGTLDWGPVLAGYVAAALLGAAYLSIGLFSSARSDNQIVSLLLASFACGAFFVIGTDFVTALSPAPMAEVLRGLGAGARFESITRGVLDFRDLYFYLSVVGVFFVLNVHAIESHGWSASRTERHRSKGVLLALLGANLLIANVWLASVSSVRLDVTQGNQYSISEATRSYLARLDEPLLIRGYFSEKTHPLLAPLVPQLKDLLTEYEVAGNGAVRLEIIDPASDPEKEDEANTKYGIRPVPFQVADRYQSSLVNSYFDVLVQYGDENEVLSFRELIEVKVRGESDLDVQLRNPEYDITRAIKQALQGFQSGGDLFSNLTTDVEFLGYFSEDARLPIELVDLKTVLSGVLDDLTVASAGRLTSRYVDPEAGDGTLAVEIAENYGFSPMAASLFDANTFYFYLTLTDGETVIEIPIPESRDADVLRQGIEEGLKRFATGLLKQVAFAAPEAPPAYMQQQMPQPPGSQFVTLREVLASDYDIESADLQTGTVAPTAEVLLVLEPEELDQRAVFAIDQFLMRGATVVVASGAFSTSATAEFLSASPANTGLEGWLAHHGVTIDSSFAMDPQNAAFPLPVIREVGGFRFQDVQMQDYPYFIDIRPDGMNEDIAPTADLPQLTMTWSSPIEIDPTANTDRSVTPLLTSSSGSWRSTSTSITPELSSSGVAVFEPEGELEPLTLGVLLAGRFESYFDESPLIPDPPALDEPEGEADQAADGESADEAAADEESDTLGTITRVIDRSPESARLIVLGSSTFVADQNLRTLGAVDGTVYVNSLQFMANVVDWAVEDETLLGIRARGHFNRTLPPMDEAEQRVWEIINYALMLIGVVVVYLVNRQRAARRRARYGQSLAPPGTSGATDGQGASA